MAVIFNAEPIKESSLCKDRVVTPDELTQLWVKVETAVAKFNRFYNEMSKPVPDNKFMNNIPSIGPCISPKKSEKFTRKRYKLVLPITFYSILVNVPFYYFNAK